MASLPSFGHVHEVAYAYPDVLGLFKAAFGGILQVIEGKLEFATFYKDTDPLATAILFASTLGVITFTLAETVRNFSQVDRLWSILPAVYIFHYCYWARVNDIPSNRVDLAATSVAVWSIRLTYNYWRKDGYKWSTEDYRWEVIRQHISKPAFFLFDLTFISFYQNYLLLAITTPAYLFLIIAKNFPHDAAENAARIDTIFSRGMMLAVILEFFADQQQWSFHQAKLAYKSSGRVPAGWDKDDLERGFLCTGLWAFSRHPNFAGEQLFWVLLYQWSAFSTDSVYNWAGLGALFYLFLFQGSTWFTEKITAGKYKDYKIYKQHVSMFLPRIQAIKEGGFYFPGKEPKED
ncbi:hypothetical protein DRE_01399 [Drechslerella stenobrocha 248]|uniref:Steroid 5-alpha reductase C-terminal domain-containing protein n=1 Tax=Drechslerella stenobrocha 248 TaxID=1043628 RepID=W7HVI0_9PEZI|nr:hypothetical protein DRE_01399 [Drechslerella stenobrocha 248]